MSLAKGRQTGFGYKDNALALNPKLVCRRKTACGITGLVVYDENGQAISSASNAHEAWYKAWKKLNRDKKEGNTSSSHKDFSH